MKGKMIMGKLKDLSTTAKNKMELYFSKTKSYCVGHKIEILYGVTVLAIGTCICYKYKNVKLENIYNSEKNSNTNLEKKVRKFEIINTSMKLVVAEQATQIKSLKDLCETKDQFYKEAISDGLRHGSPLAAQQMAYKRYDSCKGIV